MVHTNYKKKPAAGSEGISAMVETGRHRLGEGEEKGGRGSDKLEVGFNFGQREVEWIKWVEWSKIDGVEEWIPL